MAEFMSEYLQIISPLSCNAAVRYGGYVENKSYESHIIPMCAI